MLSAAYGPYGGRRSAPAEVIVYGSRWRGITMMMRRYLDRAGVPYRFVDWDAYPEVRSQLEWAPGGRLASLTIKVGGQVLVQPSTRELALALDWSGYR